MPCRLCRDSSNEPDPDAMALRAGRRIEAAWNSAVSASVTAILQAGPGRFTVGRAFRHAGRNAVWAEVSTMICWTDLSTAFAVARAQRLDSPSGSMAPAMRGSKAGRPAAGDDVE